MQIITEIKTNSTWEALIDFEIGVGSDCRNPNPKPLIVPKGTLLRWSEDSRNGNVWFIATIAGKEYRGVIESGRITNIIKKGWIGFVSNSKFGLTVYSGEFLQKLLSN